MIVLKHTERDDRVFMPDGEVGQIAGWIEKGYVFWYPTGSIVDDTNEPIPPAPKRTRQPVDFATVKNITPEMRDILHSRDILDWEDILEAGIVALARLEIDGLGMARARALFAVAQREAE